MNLINLWLLKQLPSGWNRSGTVEPFAVFAWLTNGRGRLSFRVDIAADSPEGTPTLLRRSPVQELAFSSPLETQFLCLGISGLTIKAAGDYMVELHCQDGDGNAWLLEDTMITFVELTAMKRKKRKSGYDALKPGELAPRPPDRPRIFPKGPVMPPKIVWIEWNAGTSSESGNEQAARPATRRKPPRNGRR